ncbi:MAG: RluA family pseudouridine synthase [Candidatus Ornithospirochaeta sp.]
MKKKREYSFYSEEEGRVDAVASRSLSIPRSVFSLPSLVLEIDGKEAKKSQKVKVGTKIYLSYEEEVMEGLEKEDIPLDILYEDDHILVINKEQGMVVHPGSGVSSGTVANALLGLYGEDFETGEDSLRPGIVHRLDKDTSGVMVIAKTKDAHLALTEEFSNHTNEKYYLAIAKGFFTSPEGTIDKRIARDKSNRKKFAVTDNKSEGKDALTKWRVLGQGKDYALLRLRIYTGRTHQIRVHLSSISHPVLGDPIYSRKDSAYPCAGLMLHAERLVLTHPVTGERMVFRAPVPGRFLPILEKEGIVWSSSGVCDTIIPCDSRSEDL